MAEKAYERGFSTTGCPGAPLAGRYPAAALDLFAAIRPVMFNRPCPSFLPKVARLNEPLVAEFVSAYPGL
jgi:hypothetical protein